MSNKTLAVAPCVGNTRLFDIVPIATLAHHPVYLNRNVAYGALIAKQEKRTVLVNFGSIKGWRGIVYMLLSAVEWNSLLIKQI
jgi:hypothetical protein